MSGMDALQAATSAFAIAELARQTALLLKKVYKAHKDAELLCRKTRNLSRLVENVGDVLKQRHEQPNQYGNAIDDQKKLQDIDLTLGLCRDCIRAMCDQFEPLLAPEGSRKRIRARIKMVYRQDFIATQERDINTHLATLSVLLQCLLHTDNFEQHVHEAEERQSRAQFSQNQQDMQEAFLRDLFVFFQYITRCAAAASAASSRSSTRHSAAATATAPVTVMDEGDVGPRARLALENIEAQTLDELFGRPMARPHSLESFMFSNAPRIEEVSGDEDDLILVDSHRDERLDHESIYVIDGDDDDDDDDTSSQANSTNMSQYASETTFLLAVKRGETSLIDRLIKEGVDPPAKDSYGWTVLHYAVFCLHVDIVDILLRHPAYQDPQGLNAQTSTGETALIFAVQRINQQPGYDIAMKLLEQDNCDTTISDGRGSALYYAVGQGKPTNKPRQRVVEYLAKKGADVSEVNRQIPDKVGDFPALSRFVSAIDERRDSDQNNEHSGSRADGTNRRESSARKDSTTSAKRPSLSRLFRSRTKSSSGPGTGSTPPH